MALSFYLGAQAVRTGCRGRPPKVFPKGVQLGLKNKGWKSVKSHCPRYECPQKLHPETSATLRDSDIHANPVEAYNAMNTEDFQFTAGLE